MKITLLIPFALIMLCIPIKQCLKSIIKKLLITSTSGGKIHFTNQSPCLLKVWFQKSPSGKWSLLTRYFFSYQQEGKQMSGQAIVSNATLVDIKFYPPGFQDPNGKFPLLSANDERIHKELSQRCHPRDCAAIPEDPLAFLNPHISAF